MKKPQKGDKRRYVREAIESLGLDAKFADAAKWIKDKYGVEVGDPTFYHLRKEMQQEEAKRGQPGGGAGQPSAAASAPAPRAEAKRQEAGGRAPAGEARDGVAALVLQAKALVERLGKEEAKRLIDAL